MKKNNRLLVFSTFFGLTILLWLSAVFARAVRTEGNQIVITEGEYSECAEGWYDDAGTQYNIENFVYTKEDVGTEKIFHFRIPQNVNLDGDVALCFFSRGMNFRVYSTELPDNPYYGMEEFGSREIFLYDQNAANLSGTDIGLTIHVIPLRMEDKYNEISIAITPTEYSAFILEPRIEKASDYLTSSVRSRMPRFIGSVFIIFFGFATVVYTMFAVEKKQHIKTTLYAWGVCSMLLGTQLLIQSQVIQILTGRPEFWSTLKYAVFLIIAFPSALMIDSVTQAPHKHFSRIIGYITASLMLIETVGVLFNILSFYRLWYISALLNMFNGIAAIICLNKELRHRREYKETWVSIYLLAVYLINGIVVMVDLTIYDIASKHMTDWGRLIRVYYILSIIVTLIILLRISIIRNRQVMLVEKYKSESDAKSSFLANMSHEIRTPINAVLGMNEMILRESSDEEVTMYASNIKTAGNTLLGIVNDILDFSKIEAGKLEIMPVDYDISSVINDLVNMIQTKADAKGLRLNLEMDPNIPKILRGDEVRIKQVISNILTNAVKYTEKGSVTFGITGEKLPNNPDSVVLNVYVKDTGIGIKPEDMDKLFVEFDRIEEERNRHIEGTGLGMSITQRLLEMMGSTLKVESEYGRGSVFSFRLDQAVVKWEPLGDYETSYRNALAERKKYKERFIAPKAVILVVDDNEMNRVVFRSLVKQTRVQIDLAAGGDEGLAMMRKKKYDLMFLDHLMPGKDGVETLHELKEESGNPNIDTPVICLTANAISGAREKYIAAGFNDYLTKPIDPDALEKLMMDYLPDELLETPSENVEEEQNSARESSESLEKLAPLKEHPLIDIEQGVNNNGTAEAYLVTLKIYYDSIDEKVEELNRYLSEENLKDYTVKVHALKSSLRIIGADELGEEAQHLENAGKQGDADFIREHHDSFITKCESLKTPLAMIFGKDERDADKAEADEELLATVYDEIKDAAEAMDCDRLEAIFTEMNEYTIPEKEAALWNGLKTAAEAFDYDGILRLFEKS